MSLWMLMVVAGGIVHGIRVAAVVEAANTINK